jgi:hypothetical protein
MTTDARGRPDPIASVSPDALLAAVVKTAPVAAFPVPTHKVTNVEIISDKEDDTFGVKFTFDDGEEDYAFSDNREEAEWDATDRIGEEMPIRMNPKLQSAERMKKLKDERAGTETSGGPYPDANDGKGWSEADIDDLKAALSAYLATGHRPVSMSIRHHRRCGCEGKRNWG